MTDVLRPTSSIDTALNDWKNTRIPDNEKAVSVTIPAGATVAMVSNVPLSLNTDAVVIARIIEKKVFVDVEGISFGIRESGDSLEAAVHALFTKMNTESINLQTATGRLGQLQETLRDALMSLFKCVI